MLQEVERESRFRNGQGPQEEKRTVAPVLFTEREAARYIGMSRSFLRKARMEGDRKNRTPAPPFVRVGSRAIRYRVSDLDAWIDALGETHPRRLPWAKVSA